jgi:hypothetical protein
MTFDLALSTIFPGTKYGQARFSSVFTLPGDPISGARLQPGRRIDTQRTMGRNQRNAPGKRHHTHYTAAHTYPKPNRHTSGTYDYRQRILR